MNNNLKAYLATFFFDKFGLEGTAKIAEQIRQAIPGIDLYVPQENGEINDKENNDDNITAATIYKGDRDKLLKSDVLIAYLDGVEIDSGVSAEIGMMAGYMEACKELQGQYPNKIIIGLYTDMRQVGTGDNHMYKNLFTKGACENFGVVVDTVEKVIEEMKKYLAKPVIDPAKAYQEQTAFDALEVLDKELKNKNDLTVSNVIDKLKVILSEEGDVKLRDIKNPKMLFKDVYHNGKRAFRGDCGQKYNEDNWKKYKAILLNLD